MGVREEVAADVNKDGLGIPGESPTADLGEGLRICKVELILSGSRSGNF